MKIDVEIKLIDDDAPAKAVFDFLLDDLILECGKENNEPAVACLEGFKS
jgi:hypothetical protein